MGRVVIAVLLVAAVGCKKKPPPVMEVEPAVVAVDDTLQVAAVSPNLLPIEQGAAVVVSGAGFQQGAAVAVGEGGPQAAVFRSPNQLEARIPPLPAALYDLTVVNPDGGRSTLRSGLTVRGLGEAALARCAHVVLYFETDRAGLSADSVATLDGVMDCISGGAGAISVEGHADARGTTDYNLALGQRRAQAVRTHLESEGVPGSRVLHRSFGEEQPAATGRGEAAWSQNRRVELRVSP